MFCNFMTMVEHGWTSVLKKQMIELELNLSKLADFITHRVFIDDKYTLITRILRALE